MKKRIYLDIDYVLNSKKGDVVAKKKFPKEWKLTHEGNWLPHKGLLYKFWDEEAVEALKYIIKSVGEVDIYIHSTWRNHFDLDQLKKFLEDWGVDPNLVIDTVPSYRFSAERFHRLSWHIDGERCGDEDDTEPCENYIILDDKDMTHVFNGKLKQIVTKPETGLTMEDAEKAIKILSLQD